MRTRIWICLIALAPVIGRAQNAGYRLTVALKNLTPSSKAYLVSSFGWTDQRVIDSAAVRNGKFMFQGIAIEPEKTQLVIDHDGRGLNNLLEKNADYLVVYLEPGNITISGKDSIRRASVTGSSLNAEYARYRATVLAPVEKTSEAINAEYAAAAEQKRKDTAFQHGLMAKWKAAAAQTDSLKYVYIRQHPDSYLSLEALQEVAGGNVDVTKIEPLFRNLSPRLRKSKAGADLSKLLYDDGPTAIGAMAPDFVQADVEGHPVRLSGFRGKYVLLDFWASWCGPCRAENPNVVKAYNKYKDKNFTVLGVSLDQPGKKEAWLEAIKKDSLSWTQVSDLQFWNNAAARAYDIKAIPQNFLIDPSGKIIGKNLRGEALEKKLEEVL